MLSAAMRRWIAVVLAALALGPVAVAAQTTVPGVPGNPTSPGDTVNNPHPTMPWLVTSPYGVLQRWVWIPPQPVVVNERVVYQPGFWVAQTTAGNYYPRRWVLSEIAPGTYGWVLVEGGAVPYAR
jgi:hypothetical protein